MKEDYDWNKENEKRIDYEDFKVKYTYNADNNIISKSYKVNNYSNQINHTYNNENLLTETSIDNLNIKYLYDELGRLKSKKLNDSYELKYNYVTHGKRTAEYVKDIINNNEKISYSYDAMGNIEKIYINENLANQYEYDIYNRLVMEKNYNDGYIEEYSYDINDNLITDIVKDLSTNEIINTYNFQYENQNWTDQLTKYNNKNITYDAKGKSKCTTSCSCSYGCSSSKVWFASCNSIWCKSCV